MEKVYLSLGGNIGETVNLFESAINDIKALSGVENLEISRFYHTPPLGDVSQKDFLNLACTFHTSQTPLQLLNALQEIEKKYGKEKLIENGPRTLDIDILFFGKESFENNDLTIPHPRWEKRLFVLVPLLDLTDFVQLEHKRFELAQMIKAFPLQDIKQIRCIDRSFGSIVSKHENLENYKC